MAPSMGYSNISITQRQALRRYAAANKGLTQKQLQAWFLEQFHQIIQHQSTLSISLSRSGSTLINKSMDKVSIQS